MQKHLWKSLLRAVLALLACTATLALAVYVQVELDVFPRVNGLQDLELYTEVELGARDVYVRHTGWEDTQSYFRFEARPEEIETLVRELGLVKAQSISAPRISFLWWRLPRSGGDYHRRRDPRNSLHLHFDPEAGRAHFWFLGT